MGTIKSEKIETADGGVTLVSVTDGSAAIGTCSAGHLSITSDQSSVTRLFFIGNDPAVRISCPNDGSSRCDKLISLCPGYEGADPKIRDVFSDALSRLNRGDSPEVGLHDILIMLEDGVYAVYTADYYPTDGSGAFFWGAYNIPHEVRATAERNRVIGAERTYRPCFLIPSEPPVNYIPKTKITTDEAVKSRRIQGIVYHVSGMFSVLLKGHHGAVSCVDRGTPFRCAVIEKITSPYTEEQPPAAPPAENPDQPAAPVPENKGITGFRSPSVKVPLGVFPRDMLMSILEGRVEYKPAQFNAMLKKLGTVRKKNVTNNVIPHDVLEKCERMPDSEMMESTCAVDSLSDEQLEALVSGDTELDGKVIISPNLYSSIITACSFLQFKDTSRFINFVIKVMSRPELSATHDYVARRAAAVPYNAKLYKFFKDMKESGDVQYEKISAAADRYIADYESADK